MAQPNWETVYETDYSKLMRDKTEQYAPELEIRQEIDDSQETDGSLIETIQVVVFRFSLDRLKLVADEEDPLKSYLVPVRYDETWPYAASRYEEWFVKSLPDVAASVICEVEELIAALTGEDIHARAWAYECIGGHHGFMSLDAYPDVIREEV